MTIDLFRKISEITSQGKACVLVTGGASPEEIALFVAAEISAVKHGKNEIRHMRDR